MNRSSLRVKLIASMVGIVLLVEVATLLFVYFRLSATLNNELVTTGVAVSSSFASSSSQLVATNNLFALNQLVDETLAANPDVRYVIVMDVNGNVLADSFDQGIPGGLLQANTSQSGKPYNLALIDTKQGVIRDLAVPISDGKWGTVRVGLSDARLQGILAATTRSILIVTVIVLLLAIAFVYVYFGLLIIRPVSELNRVAQAVSQGDLTKQANIHSQDELGTLAFTFNTMTTQLRETLQQSEQRVAERTKALSNVAEISTVASTILDTQEMLATVVHLTQRRFGLYHAHVFLYDETAEELKIVACGWKEGDEHEGTHGTTAIPIGQEQSLVARAARAKQAVIVNDVRADPGWLPNPLLPDTASELAIPMLIGEQVIGVLDVQSDRLNAFTEADANIQTTLGSQVAVAVQNATNFSRAETSRQEAQSLVDYAPEAIIIVDLETGLFTDPNANAEKLYGLPRSELMKVGPAQMSPSNQPDGRDSTEKAMEKIGEAMQGGTPIFEWMHRNAQGQDILCEVRLVRLPGAHPRVRASVADITERKHLLELTTQRAKQQESLNLITQKIQNTTSVEAALQIAARELGHALGMKPTLVALDPAALAGENKGN